MRCLAIICVWLLISANERCGLPSGAADEPAREVEKEEVMPIKTFGGRQFWGDVLFFHDWRIQRNVFTGHYRLLDGKDNRHLSGTLDECKAKLDEIREARKLPKMSGRGVVLIHGIVRSSKTMAKLREPLEKSGFTVFPFDYPSTRVTLEDSAEYLHQVLESLEGLDEIHLVVHSLGGLVVRSYLQKHRDPRIKRMVMLGVPNHGAELADMLDNNVLFKAIFGPAGHELVTNGAGTIAKLPTPDFEFAVIAGSRGTDDGYNPLIPGDDDGLVSVASTRLPGAADFLTVTCWHTFLMSHPDVIAATNRFLTTGRLREDGDAQPIPMEEQTPER
jgi:pimeloyl-ACP methyl ester carboxylesterase